MLHISYRQFFFFQAPASDTGLVDLFCSWACKIGKQDLYSSSSAKGVCPTIRSFHVDEDFKSNGHKLQFDHHSFSFPGLGMTNNNFKVSSLSTAKSSFLFASQSSGFIA